MSELKLKKVIQIFYKKHANVVKRFKHMSKEKKRSYILSGAEVQECREEIKRKEAE